MNNRYIAAARMGVFALFGLIAYTNLSSAQTTVNCATSSGALVTLAQSGTMTAGEYRIEGECVGNVTISNPGVTLDTSPTGAAVIQISGSVIVTAPNITLGSASLGFVVDGSSASAGTAGVTVFGNVTGIVLEDVTVQNFPGNGVSAGGTGTLFIEGGTISGNTNCGLFIYSGMNAELDSDVLITANGNGSSTSLQCGIDVEDNAVLYVTATNVHDNLNGPGLRIFQAVGDITGGTFQAPSTVTSPAVVLENARVSVVGATIEGTGNSDVVFAVPGTSIILRNSSVTESDGNANDATIRLATGSTLLSLGGNTIGNSANGGTVLVASNGSSFRQQIETNLNLPTVADTITGTGAIEVESNIELGTGAANPTTWNGSINVAQNSSVRMDGGITVNGSVNVGQASNGFFNHLNTGMNVVTGGVLCPFSTNQAAHVSASAASAQLANGSAAVTFGSAPNNCLSF